MNIAADAPGFQFNFFSSYSVLLDQTITKVFLVIGTSEGHERVTRLSGLCSSFDLFQADTVNIPESISLAETHVRIRPSSVDDYKPEPPYRVLPRQFFALKETVPLLFGLFHTDVHLSGSLTWDEVAKVALYESRTESGILVWKLREFKAVDGGKTKVTETIQGSCPRWLKSIVQSQTSKAHM